MLLILLSSISIIIWYYLYSKWKRNNKQRAEIGQNLPLIHQALNQYKKLTNFENYLSNTQSETYLQQAKQLWKCVPTNYHRIGLSQEDLAMLDGFKLILTELPQRRTAYNEQFVPKEIQRYTSFFSNLEPYPLSQEQMEAIVRDEDNNLVIAGAGTGKTTTISAKIAYLLEKKLAQPEDLLIISFTKSAVTEMFDRSAKFCKREFSDGQLEVKTFNAFGYMVNRTCSQSPLRLAFDGDEHLATDFLSEAFENLFLNNPDFQRKAINYIAFFERPQQSEFDFDNKNAQLKYEQSFANLCLNGQKMKSGQEVAIANFLFLNGIDFEYEKFFPLKAEDRNPRFADYCPDFYLPKYEIWHEHFGIDENGNVPAYFKRRPPFSSAKDYYQDGMLWKEGIHTKYGTKFIKTYSYESRQNKLLTNLKQQLLEMGVEFSPRFAEEILAVIKERPIHQEFIKLIYTFLGLMKSNNRNPSELKAKGKKDPRFKVFLEIFSPMFQAYEERLRKDAALDYNDMVNRASALVSEGIFTKRYKYILVDEFQDMSIGRYKLLKSLLESSPGCKLYAVGDDWQSIFRFTGTDISIMTAFSSQFGVTHLSKISRTYRFNKEILAATSAFVQRNPAQIKKELVADREALEPSFEPMGLNIQGLNAESKALVKSAHLDRILSELERKGSLMEVFLIGRYNFSRPVDFKGLQKRHPMIRLSFHTTHRVKGLTCDYAIVLDLDSGVFGFPSEVADDPILSYLLREGESFENAEERRLFYVALTRARNKVYLMYDQLAPSKFVTEFFGGELAGEGDNVQKICPQCEGIMVPRKSSYGSFFGCSNYPECDITLSI